MDRRAFIGTLAGSHLRGFLVALLVLESSMVARYHQPGRRRSARHGRRGTPRGPPSGPVSARRRDIVAAEAHDPLAGMVRPQCLVVCSCGWEREASSAWAAESMSKLHRKLGRAQTERHRFV